MTVYNAFRIGNVAYPLTTTSEAETLRDADPALYYAIDFWVYIIQTYVGGRLLQELSEAGITWAGQPITQAVAQWYPFEPLPEQLENQFAFPLFAAYRTEAQTVRQTAGWEGDVCALELLYILPPLDAAGAQRILPIFRALAGALRAKTSDAFDPGYTPPGGSPGQQFDSAPFGGVQEIGFGEDRYPAKNQSRFYRYGFLQSAQQADLYFPTLKLFAFVRERDMYGTGPSIEGVPKFAGADITGDLVAADGTVIQNFVQASTQQAPTVSSLSVTSGPIAGGTSVTITGTLFLPGPPQVQFGSQYAPSVTFNSATSLTVTTPAMQGAGSVSLTITNRDGQSVFAANAFTFA